MFFSFSYDAIMDLHEFMIIPSLLQYCREIMWSTGVSRIMLVSKGAQACMLHQFQKMTQIYVETVSKTACKSMWVIEVKIINKMISISMALLFNLLSTQHLKH